jgi:acyl-CoA synthetase (AMP-forming)/AMP-acid ligase II
MGEDAPFLKRIDFNRTIYVMGNEVDPVAVEGVLMTHPAVSDAAVIGVIDPFIGFCVKAVVSFVSGSAADAQDVKAFCRGKLPAYMCPRLVEIVTQIPTTASGAPDRVLLGDIELDRMRGRPKGPI